MDCIKQLDQAGSVPLTRPTHTQAVNALLMTLKSTAKALCPSEYIGGCFGGPLYVAVFLIHAVGLFPELMLVPKIAISGPRGNGCLDYAIVSKEDTTRMLAVTTHERRDDHSLTRTMVQLDTISSGRKQDSRDGNGDGVDLSPVTSYGIVTDSISWTFLECKTDVFDESGYNYPKFIIAHSAVSLDFLDEHH